MAQVPVATKDTVLKFKSAPLVPTEPCMITTPLESLMRKCPAEPVLFTSVSDVMAAAVAVPPDADPKDGSEQVSVANRVPESPSVVAEGAEPVNIRIVAAPEPPSISATMASTAAFLAKVEIFID
jgi:hypothetical protein